MTDALGQASATGTLGTVAGTNNNTYTGSVTGLTGSPQTFTASALANKAPDSFIDIPSGNVTITEGQRVHFGGTGTDPDNHLPLSFLWNFGGGATNSTLEDPGQ